jgi:hypothetical protein
VGAPTSRPLSSLQSLSSQVYAVEVLASSWFEFMVVVTNPPNVGDGFEERVRDAFERIPFAIGMRPEFLQPQRGYRSVSVLVLTLNIAELTCPPQPEAREVLPPDPGISYPLFMIPSGRIPVANGMRACYLVRGLSYPVSVISTKY